MKPSIFFDSVLREFFQNEGGDIETLTSQIATVFYALGGQSPLDLNTFGSILWNYLKVRDGNVLKMRGTNEFLPKIFPSFPKETFHVEKTPISFNLYSGESLIISISMNAGIGCNFVQDTIRDPQSKTWC